MIERQRVAVSGSRHKAPAPEGSDEVTAEGPRQAPVPEGSDEVTAEGPRQAPVPEGSDEVTAEGPRQAPVAPVALSMSVTVDELHPAPSALTGISPLATITRDPVVTSDRQDMTDLPRIGDWARDREPLEAVPARRLEVASRFEFHSVDDDVRRAELGRARRAVQGMILLTVVAAVGGLIWALPESEEAVAAESRRASRIETAAEPVATADEMLSSPSRTEVQGSLKLLSSTGRLGSGNIGSTSSIGTPDYGGDGFAIAVAEEIQRIDTTVARSTTTAWVEPEIPPSGEWVDAGSGFAVPDLLLRIRFCESTNNYQAANPSSSARGAYQFLNKSWQYYGHAARTGTAQAHLATPAQQDEAALLTLQSQGTGPWKASRSCWADENINPAYASVAPRPARTTTTAVTTTATDPDSTTTTGGTGSVTSASTVTTAATGSSSTTGSTVPTSTTGTTMPSTTGSTAASTTASTSAG